MSQPLPPGMTFTEEYEGVNGKSGLPGSGRVGPIDVTDGKEFTPPQVRRSLRGDRPVFCSAREEKHLDQNYPSRPQMYDLLEAGRKLPLSPSPSSAPDVLLTSHS